MQDNVPNKHSRKDTDIGTESGMDVGIIGIGIIGIGMGIDMFIGIGTPNMPCAIEGRPMSSYTEDCPKSSSLGPRFLLSRTYEQGWKVSYLC